MESAQGTSQGQDTQVPAPAMPTDEPKAHEKAEERTFRQSDVNDIVGRAKREAVEQYRRLQETQPEYAEKKYGKQEQPPVTSIPDDNIKKIVADEMQRSRDQWLQEARTRSETEYAQKIVQSFTSKVQAGKERYEDFDKVTSGIQLDRYPSVVQILASDIDNAADVFYHLCKDEAKMMSLQRDAEDPRFQHIALSNAKKFAQSIKDNEQASKVRVPNAPLSQMRPSNLGTDSGVMSVKDYRLKYKV